MAYHGRFRKSAAKGRNAAAVFGSSPEALLHQDLLPLLASVKGDEGGRAELFFLVVEDLRTQRTNRKTRK
jgi:hypothetical protein